MKPVWWLILVACSVAWTLAPGAVKSAEVSPAQPGETVVRFDAVPVYVDPRGKPLAAYQFELSARNARITIVGVENGEHPAFVDAPYVDQEAILQGQTERIVVAAFSLLPTNELPSDRIRVATVMVQVEGPQDTPVDYQLKLLAAGTIGGEPIPVTLDRGDTP